MNRLALQKIITFLDSWLAYRSRHITTPGFSVAIISDDRIIFSRAYGKADIESRQALTTQHRFSAASQSKMITATIVLQLVQSGRIRLDDPVVQYAPWLKKHEDKRIQQITIRQLLSHSAGLVRDGLETDFWSFDKPFPTMAALRRMVLDAPLVLEPNTTLKYSNMGYALLGPVIEAASGEAYQDYATQHIFLPLNMTGTTADYVSDLHGHTSSGYGRLVEHHYLKVGERRSLQSFIPVVGIHTTAEDMCLFVASHFDGNETLLSDSTKREAHRTQWAVNGGYDHGMEFGLGFEIQTVGERRIIGHTGHLAGHESATFFDPQERIAVSAFTNSRDGESSHMVRGIFEVFDFFSRATGEKDTFEHFTGRYTNIFSSIEILSNGAQIIVIDPDGWEPFGWHEELERVDDATLRITTPGSVMNRGEVVQYMHDKKTRRPTNTIRFAGTTMYREDNK